MRSWLWLTILLVVPDLAHAEGFERSPVARPVGGELAHSEVAPDPVQDPGGPGAARFACALEARVGHVLDRSTDLAAARAVAWLEVRDAERLDRAARSAARHAEQQLVSVRWRLADPALPLALARALRAIDPPEALPGRRAEAWATGVAAVHHRCPAGE